MSKKKIWLITATCLYLVLGLASHFYFSGNPRKILVAVDSCFNMKEKESRILELLRKINNGYRYSSFALITDKAVIHSFQARLRSKNLSFYGPRNLQGLTQGMMNKLSLEADKKILISNATGTGLSGWKVYKLP